MMGFLLGSMLRVVGGTGRLQRTEFAQIEPEPAAEMRTSTRSAAAC
jgi:hypothetical protein